MDPASSIRQTLRDNIEAFDQRRRESERRAGKGEQISVAVTRLAGNFAFLAAHTVIFAVWMVINLGLVPGIRPFDRTLVMLATFASVEAIFLSIFVLIAQNRMANAAERRAELDLHMSLLSEAELTRLADLTLRIAEQVGVEAPEQEIREVAQVIDPGAVIDELDRRDSK